jgi:hypothetical protein
LVEVIGLGNGRLLQPGALLGDALQRCDNEVIDRFGCCCGYAGDFQSPPVVTTLAACAANASETDHFPHNRLVEREEMREWPGTDSVEEPFFGFDFAAPLSIIQPWLLSARSSRDHHFSLFGKR